MLGTILWNFWAALFSFSIYFFIIFQKPISPVQILMESFISGIIGFILMYVLRFLLGYILYTPDDTLLNIENLDITENETIDEQIAEHTRSQNSETEERSPKEIANIVRAMLD